MFDHDYLFQNNIRYREGPISFIISEYGELFRYNYETKNFSKIDESKCACLKNI